MKNDITKARETILKDIISKGAPTTAMSDIQRLVRIQNRTKMTVAQRESILKKIIKGGR